MGRETGKDFASDMRVTIHRKENGYRSEDISGYVCRAETRKVYGKAHGSFYFNAIFKHFKGKRLDELIKLDDIVLIEMDAGDGSGLKPVMLGLVGRVGRKFSTDYSGNPSRNIQVAGEDLGRLLVSHNCTKSVRPIIGDFGPEDVTQIQNGLIFSGTPREMLDSIFNTLLVGQLPWVKDRFAIDLEDGKNADNWQTYDYPITRSTGSVWEAMKRIANEPYNILTTETIGRRLHIIHERFPVDGNTGKLSRGKFIPVYSENVLAENLAVSNSEMTNYCYFEVPSMVIFGNSNGSPLRWRLLTNMDKASIPVHGFRPWFPQTNFCPPRYTKGTNAPPNIQKAAQARALALWNQVKDLHTLENGRLTIHGQPGVRCGCAILREENGFEYLVEGVHHDFAWGSHFRTNLELTRGQKH